MKVTLIDHMGSDLTVVNAARVSFDKESDWVYNCSECGDVRHPLDYEFGCVASNDDGCMANKSMSSGDQKLIKYLATHGHWTPFAHPQVQLHIKAPIFVARQLGKHQVGMVWNEVSRRYVDSEPEFYWPDKWRGRAANKKQGSSGEVPVHPGFTQYIKDTLDDSLQSYVRLIEEGVAPEQARMILPQNTYTEWYWTGSLAAWARVYGLRIKEDTQEETRKIAKQIGEIVGPLFPVSWEALTNG